MDRIGGAEGFQSIITTISICSNYHMCHYILVVIVVKIIFIHSFLFYCLLYNHSFKTNPNSVTNLSKLFNYIAPASLFEYIFLGNLLTRSIKRITCFRNEHTFYFIFWCLFVAAQYMVCVTAPKVKSYSRQYGMPIYYWTLIKSMGSPTFSGPYDYVIWSHFF